MWMAPVFAGCLVALLLLGGCWPAPLIKCLCLQIGHAPCLACVSGHNQHG